MEKEICPLTSAVIVFSKALIMACHEISDLNKYLSNNIFPVYPNWATLFYLNKRRKFDK